ncbi:MAG TPA: adenylate/guanylate cyclase domain-containing protein, partial [Candidatus Ozemobacteraceae bacterium]|nr:adenylate/guanylate cyclase domain-containing protein [Candidatus Ozemobacteraceae bacterium]
PGACEVADDLCVGEDLPDRPDSRPGSQTPGEPAAEPHPSSSASPVQTRSRTAQNYILFIILILAAGLLFSFSRMLTHSYRERAAARERAELHHDLRLAASTNDPVIQIANHLLIMLMKDLPSETARAGSAEGRIAQVQERLQQAKRIYPALSWSILRHLPDRDIDCSAISLRSTAHIESAGIPLEGRASETAALFSRMKAVLMNGYIAGEAQLLIQPLISRMFHMSGEQSCLMAFESFGHFSQCELFGTSGYLMWEPIVHPGWWNEYQKLIDAAPDSRTPGARWWQEMLGGVILFLPFDAVNESAGLQAMTQTMLARGTRLALLSRDGSMRRAIGSDTFTIRPSDQNALVVRRPTNLEEYPELVAARMILQPPRWMSILESALSGLSYLLALAAFAMLITGIPSRIAALFPGRLVPLLAAAFTLTLLPSLLSGWLAGERRMIERQARLFDETSDRLSTALNGLDEGMSWYIGQNMAVFRHLSTGPDITSQLEQIASLTDKTLKEAAGQKFLDDFFKRGWESALSMGDIHILGPGGISFLNAVKNPDGKTSLLRELYGSVHSQVLRRLSPAFAASEANTDEKKRILENLKGEEIKYLLLSMLPAYDFASMMSAPVQYHRLVWGLNSHESFRIHLQDTNGRPQYALQGHLADDTLLHQQLRNRCEAPGSPGTPVISMARNNPRLTLPFSTLIMRFSERENRITADLNSHLAHPVEAAADLLAGTAQMPVHTLLEHDSETDLLMTQPGIRQREFLLKARLPYSRLLGNLSREAGIRRGMLILILFLSLYMALRTASRFLKPVQSLSIAAGEIMEERFDTRLPTDRQDEFGDLALAFNAMATGVEEGRRLRVFVSDSVRTAAGNESRSKAAMAGESRSAAVLFAAPADFSRLLQEEAPEVMISLLNRYLSEMSGLIRRNGGEIDKFIGEKILAVFDAERHGGLEAASRAAAQAATGMREAMKGLEGKRPLSLGIGIVAGPVLAGIMGTAEVRLEYTVIGDTVNTAARLCDLALKSGGGTVIDGTVSAALHGRPMSSVGEILVKGKARYVIAFRLD